MSSELTDTVQADGEKKGLFDTYNRQINYLRISVTDHCNLNCMYCSVGSILPLKHEDILSYEEIEQLVRAAAEMGINKVRLTGGEPLMRPHFSRLVRMINEIDGIDDIAVTTNGILLARFAGELKDAGLNRVNISLDTLKAEKFKMITGHDRFDDVLKGIETAHRVGLEPVKINMVVLKDVNDDEIVDFARKTIDDGWNVRYIEFMPIGSPNGKVSEMVTTQEIKERIQVLGELEPYKELKGNGPAKVFRIKDSGGSLGFITPVTEHFCATCNRLRVTSDGSLRPCLLSEDELNIKKELRSGISVTDLKKLIQQAVNLKRKQHNLDGKIGPDSNDRPMCQIGG
ncbi:MAG: GTP 3',8-cyclase MoaA [Dehalococcoidales bacterium]|nr:GTP 3',8-cyclase MoaA [Dehalococcoidales bacterium]